MKRAFFYALSILYAFPGTSVTKQRLVAEAHYSGYVMQPFYITDSARYFYSGFRHSGYDYTTMNYLILENFDYSYFGPAIRPDGANLNNIDSFYRARMNFDSAYIYKSDSIGANLYQSHKAYQQYNDVGTTDYLRKDYSAAGDPSAIMRTIGVYEGGRLVKAWSLKNNNGSWDTVRLNTFEYDQAGYVTSNHINEYVANRPVDTLRFNFVYNAEGCYTYWENADYDPASARYIPQYAKSLTYYPDKTVKLVLNFRQSAITHSLVPDSRDSFGYTPGVPGFTYHLISGIDSLWRLTNSVLVTSDCSISRNRSDSVLFSSWSGKNWMPYSSIRMFYNSDGNPWKQLDYTGAGTFAALNDVRNYYYELFDDPSGVLSAFKDPGNISLSPNPANRQLSLHYPGTVTHAPVSIKILNMAGQLIYTESLVLQSNKEDIILGDEVDAGQYIISVQDQAGHSLLKQKFTKL